MFITHIYNKSFNHHTEGTVPIVLCKIVKNTEIAICCQGTVP